MPRLQVVLNSFATGEISPRLSARVDLAKHAAACECLHNYLVFPQGGVTRRPGLRYVAEAKTSADGCVRLLRFEPTSTRAYVIEMGCLYLRFYNNNTQVKANHDGLFQAIDAATVEVVTPYTNAQLFDVKIVPSIDVLYLLHPSHCTRKLERYASDCWRFRTVPFAPPPSIEVGTRPNADISVGALTGDNVTLTAFNCDAFLVSDCGREILITGGSNRGARAGIASVTSARIAVINVCVAFALTTVTCSKLWRLTGSPITGVTPGQHEAVGRQNVTLTADFAAWRGGVNGYRDDGDCGKFVLLNGGCFEITAVNSATVALATIRGNATPATAAKAEAGNWTLEEALFSACNGFAEVGAFHDGRLYLASGHRFVGSKTGDYENFAPGAVDDDGILFALDADVLEQIRWMHGREGLLLGTFSSEWEAIGSTDAPITASNIQVRRETSHGASRVAPLHIGPATVFIQRGGRHLRELAFVFEVDQFQAPDLLLLAEHLTRRTTVTETDPTIVDLAYQQRPDSRLWAVRSDGVLLCCTYIRDQNIVAWSRITTAGTFESVAVIPHAAGDRDQVWVSVRRTVNGQARRYIEYFDDGGTLDPTLQSGPPYYGTLYVDAGWVCNSSTPVTKLTGLAHLEGATVQIVGDGRVYPKATVVSGDLTISPCAKIVEVGLPYTSDLVTMRPEVPIGGQTSLPAKLSWRRLVIHLLDTLGMQVGTSAGEEIVPFRRPADCMGWAPPLFSGKKELSHLGWDEAQVIVRQTQPLPSTIVAISGVLDVGGA